jgi:hypothetical protein
VLAELLKVSEMVAVLCPVISVTPSGLHLEVVVHGDLKSGNAVSLDPNSDLLGRHTAGPDVDESALRVMQIGRTSLVCAVDTAQPSQAAATQGSSAQRQTISQLVPGIQQALLLARVGALTFGELEPRQIFADLDLEVHIPASLQTRLAC